MKSKEKSCEMELTMQVPLVNGNIRRPNCYFHCQFENANKQFVSATGIQATITKIDQLGC